MCTSFLQCRNLFLCVLFLFVGYVRLVLARPQAKYIHISNGGYLEVVGPRLLPLGNSARTISLWILLVDFDGVPGPSGQGYNRIVSWGDPTGGSGTEFAVYVANTVTDAAFCVSGGSTGLFSISGARYKQQWTHVAITHENSRFVLYVDGIGEETTRTLSTKDNLLRFGVDVHDYLLGEAFSVYLDDVRIWNRALSLDEILCDADGVINRDGLVSAWDGSVYQGKLRDWGPGANHATFVGDVTVLENAETVLWPDSVPLPSFGSRCVADTTVSTTNWTETPLYISCPKPSYSIACAQIRDCHSCASTPGCGWCNVPVSDNFESVGFCVPSNREGRTHCSLSLGGSLALFDCPVESIPSVPDVWWNFDESLSSIGDSSVSLSGSPLYAPTPHSSGVQFDGGAQRRLSAAHNDAITFIPTDPYTVMCWFRAHTSDAGFLFLKNRQYGIRWRGAASSLLAYDGAGHDGARSDWQLRRWYHVVLRSDSSKTVGTLFVNGLIDVSFPSTRDWTVGTFALDVGHYDYDFHGVIDDLMLFRSALSDNAIIALTNWRPMRLFALDAVRLPHDDARLGLGSHLVEWFDADYFVGTNASLISRWPDLALLDGVDQYAFNDDERLMPLFEEDVHGVSALYFDGTDFLDTAAAPLIGGQSGWIYVVVVRIEKWSWQDWPYGPYGYIYDRSWPSIPLVSLLVLNGTYTLQIRFVSGEGLFPHNFPSCKVDLDSFQVISLRRNVDSGYFEFYVNGRICSSLLSGGTLTPPTLRIAGHSDADALSTPGYNSLFGWIREFRIYDSSLTDEEFDRLHLNLIDRHITDGRLIPSDSPTLTFFACCEPGSASVSVCRDFSSANESLLFWLSFDDVDSIVDVVNDNVVSVSGTPMAFKDSIVNGAAHFDGNTYLDIGQQWSPRIQSSLSVMFWVRISGTDIYGAMTIVDCSPSSTPIGFRVDVFDDGSLRLVAGEGVQPGYLPSLLSELWMPIPFDEWVHVAVTYDSMQARMYVNGTLVFSVDKTESIPENELSVRIGANHPVDSYNFVGELDELSVWRRALSPGEIQAVFVQSLVAVYGVDVECDALSTSTASLLSTSTTKEETSVTEDTAASTNIVDASSSTASTASTAETVTRVDRPRPFTSASSVDMTVVGITVALALLLIAFVLVLCVIVSVRRRRESALAIAAAGEDAPATGSGHRRATGSQRGSRTQRNRSHGTNYAQSSTTASTDDRTHSSSSPRRLTRRSPRPPAYSPRRHQYDSVHSNASVVPLQPLAYHETSLVSAAAAASANEYAELQITWACSSCKNINPADAIICLGCSEERQA